MNNSKLISILIIFVSLLQISCTLKGPYVGNRYNTSNWCKYPIGNSPCKYETEHVIIIVNKFEQEAEGEYYMEGVLDLSRGGAQSFNSVTTADSCFFLVLAQNQTVVKTKSFLPFMIETKRKVPFDLKFKSSPFDSYTFSYQLSVFG